MAWQTGQTPVRRRRFLGVTGAAAAGTLLPLRSALAASASRLPSIGDIVLLKGGMVVDAREVIGAADVLVRNGRTAAVGPNLSAPGAFVVDCRGKVVTAAWTDPHSHGWEYPFAFLANQLGFGGYLGEVTIGYLSKMTTQEVAFAEYASLVEALNQGIATVGMWCHGIRSLADAKAILTYANRAGIRAMFMYGYDSTKFPVNPGPNLDDVLQALRFAAKLPGIAKFGLAVPGYEFTSLDTFRQEVTFADKYLGSRPLFSQHAGIPGFYKPELFQAVADAGLIHAGHNYVHGAAYEASQLQVLAKAGAKLVTAPIPDTRVFGGVQYQLAVAAGLAPSVSTDDVAYGGGRMNDQFTALATAQQAAANAPDSEDPSLISDLEVIATATTNAQAALGLSGGLLAVGAPADIMVVRPSMPLYPQNAASHVTKATPDMVELVMVGGTVRKYGGTLLGVNLAEVRARAAEIAERVLNA